MPAYKPLTLIVDATVSPLENATKQAKTFIADLALNADQLADRINAAYAKAGAGSANTLQTQKQLIAGQQQLMRAMEQGARVQMAGYDTGTARGALEAAEALQVLADKHMQVSVAAQTATGANARETLALREVQAANLNLAHSFAAQADTMHLHATVMAKVQGGMEGVALGSGRVVEGQRRMGIAGMEMMHVVRASGDSFAAGLPPMMIFTEQLGRVADAAAFAGAEGSLGKFGAFMGGPWGIAMIGGVTVLGALIGHLDLLTTEAEKNAKAMDEVKAIDDGVATAQGALGQMFDLATGKLKDQTDVIRSNIDMMITKLRIDAMAADAEAQRANKAANTEGWGAYAARTVANAGAGMAASAGFDPGAAIRQFPGKTMAGQMLDDVRAGRIPSYKALEWAAHADFSRLAISKAEFFEGVGKAKQAQLQEQTADKAEKSLESGHLDPAFLHHSVPRAGRSGRTPADTSASDANSVTQALDRSGIELAKLATVGVTDPNELATLQEAEIDAARKRQSDATIATAAQHHWTAQQLIKQQLEDDVIADLKADQIEVEAAAKIEEASKQAQLDALHLKAQLLDIEGQLAPTLQERKRIALQLLDLERQEALLKAKPEDRAGIEAAYAGKRQLTEGQFLGPMGQYRKHLHETTDDIDTALEGVKAHGLQGLEDGLVGLISGTESVASAFKRMAASIIADLARIAIEKALVSFLGLKTGLVPGHASGSVPGFAGGVISGPGTGTSDSILAWHAAKGLIRVSNGESIITAEGTRRHRNLLRAINEGRLPGYADGMLDAPLIADVSRVVYPTPPSLQSIRGGGQVVQHFTFDMRGAITTAELMAQVNGRINAVGQAAVFGGANLAQAQINEHQMTMIPV